MLHQRAWRRLGDSCGHSVFRLLPVAFVVLLHWCASAQAQRLAPPLDLIQVAKHLEAFGVHAPPLELARAHRDYVLAVVTAQTTLSARTRSEREVAADAGASDQRAFDQMAAAVDSAERALYARISVLAGDSAPAVEMARIWSRIERVNGLGHDQTGTMNRLGSPFIPPASERLSSQARIQLLRELGTHAAALDRRHTEFARLYREVESISHRDREQEAGRQLQRELFQATLRVLEAQWNIQREVEARLTTEDAARLRDRFISERLGRFESNMFAEDGWVAPEDASPSTILIRLRRAGVVTAENEPRVRARLAELVKAERALGTRAVETLIAPLRPWSENETRYERAKALLAPIASELAALRLAAAKDLAEMTHSPWLLDAALPQPHMSFDAKLSPEDEAIVGRWNRNGSYASGADQIAGFLASPMRLDSKGSGAWVRVFGLDADQEPLVIALLDRADEQWTNEVAPELAAAAAIAGPLVEELLVIERSMAKRGALPSIPDDSSDAVWKRLEDLSARRVAAWQKAIAIIDAFADDLGELLGDRITAADQRMIRAAPRMPLARTLVQRSNPYVMEAVGGAPIDPLALLLDLLFTGWRDGARDGQQVDRLTLGVTERELTSAVAAGVSPLDEAARAILRDLAMATQLQLLTYAGWAIPPRNQEALAGTAERAKRHRSFGRDAMQAWRKGEQHFFDGLAVALPSSAVELRRCREDAAFPFLTHPRRGLQSLKFQLTRAGVDPSETAAIFAIVEPDIEECVARCIDFARQDSRAQEGDGSDNMKALMDRWGTLTQMLVAAQSLSPTPAWVLSRTLPAETLARCPTLAHMRKVQE